MDHLVRSRVVRVGILAGLLAAALPGMASAGTIPALWGWVTARQSHHCQLYAGSRRIRAIRAVARTLSSTSGPAATRSVLADWIAIRWL